MPIGTGDWMLPTLERASNGSGARFRVVSNPEFLREGSAVDDFRHPDRVVLGGTEPEAIDRVASLYRDLQPEPPIIQTDIRTAEMIKYASNAFLATKISFINEIASICERLGADVKEVSRGMGLDRRISPEFLDAGVGYGGSCFPKDVKALAHMASMAGAHPQLLRAVMEINRDMRRLVLQKVRARAGQRRGSHDRRARPGVQTEHRRPARVAGDRDHPPAQVGGRARQSLRSGRRIEAARAMLPGVELCSDAYAVAEGADALMLITHVERVPPPGPGSGPQVDEVPAAGRRAQPVRPGGDGRQRLLLPAHRPPIASRRRTTKPTPAPVRGRASPRPPLTPPFSQ